MQANPVIVKELRGRMRGWRAAVILAVYLAILSIVTWLLYYSISGFNRGYTNAQQAAQTGKFLFYGLVIFQTIMVALLTPAFTAGSITSEREQKTYDLLMTTLLPARSVIFGKLGSALAYVVLLILAVAPLESMAFIFGGVAPEEIVLSQVTMLVAALLFASVGIFWSSILRSTLASNVLTYGTIIFEMLLVPFLFFTITSIMGAYSYSQSGQNISSTELYSYIMQIVLSLNPLVAMSWSAGLYSNGDSLFIYTSHTIVNGKSLLVVSPWLIFCIEALLISALLIFISIRRVRPVHYHSQTVTLQPQRGPQQELVISVEQPTAQPTQLTLETPPMPPPAPRPYNPPSD